MAPIVHGLESEYSQRVKFVYLDITDPANNDFLKSVGFRGTPHFFLLNGSGEVIQQWVGTISADNIRTSFDNNLQ
jgi:hypothetical protein